VRLAVGRLERVDLAHPGILGRVQRRKDLVERSLEREVPVRLLFRHGGTIPSARETTRRPPRAVRGHEGIEARGFSRRRMAPLIPLRTRVSRPPAARFPSHTPSPHAPQPPPPPP